MVLPAPHLDDRDFQSLVDDAKRLVQQRSPDSVSYTHLTLPTN